ncbi:hypothetical protein JMJ77_0010130 [Colletotrichum scovillei]|uniref:Uncharacterized protein n=1 Tax=Colletotrichum scovillei TaxID=1209932 RepID=A0A9P7QT11_9PEZI|nr:hypothetical protein JMJ78_0011509 [Colletotrichum scovillei]KAG7042023.1 hypothetical protein JMJ77_0010130 [Colletotrichum scovillei]KAG7062054.1 hypothetical protein JMJ76_0006337 [Colletotrichum scovillei]
MRALKFPSPDRKIAAKILSNVNEGELVYTPTPPSKPRLVTSKGYYALHKSIEASKGEDKGSSAHASLFYVRMKVHSIKPA